MKIEGFQWKTLNTVSRIASIKSVEGPHVFDQSYLLFDWIVKGSLFP